MNFNELNHLLGQSASGNGASECHGFLCGYLCVRDHLEESVLRECLMAETEESEMSSQCVGKLMHFAGTINQDIASEDFSLRLMLPPDSAPLNERSNALIQWCSGFLSGLGVAGITDFELLSPQCRELIQDLYKICRLDLDNIAEDSESDESALTELIEYVRMGAIMVHDELRSHTEQRPDSIKLH